MKNKGFAVVLISALKDGALIVAITGLFSMVPVDIVYYLLNRQHSSSGRVDALPLEWLCAVSLVIAIVYLVPIMAGGAALASALWLSGSKISKHLAGYLLGGVCGVVFFAVGTECFLRLTQEHDLANWIFWAAMLCWGSIVFAWMGHRIEALCSTRSLAASLSASR